MRREVREPEGHPQGLAGGHYGHGSRQELVSAVASALFGLAEARGFLERAHGCLREAAGSLSHMGGHWPDEGEAVG